VIEERMQELKGLKKEKEPSHRQATSSEKFNTRLTEKQDSGVKSQMDESE